jgi:hypothetical protein
MLLNLSAAVLGGYLLSFATERAHIAHRKVKLRNLLGHQNLLPGLNPRHLVALVRGAAFAIPGALGARAACLKFRLIRHWRSR